jgi:hypothetical protein
MKIGSFYDDGTDNFKVGKFVTFIFCFGIIVFVFIWGFNMITRPARTVTQVVEKTLEGDNVLYNYEWFKQSYEDYKSLNNKIVISKTAANTFIKDAGPRDKWTFEDKTEYSRLSAITQGLQSQRADLVATYNARSKMVNRNIFQTGVPERLEN